MSQTNTTEQDIDESTRYPLATRAPLSFSFAGDLVTLSKPKGDQAEAIRVLRTHVMAQHIERGRRSLSVCAASANVGCSYIAANLAVALSEIGIKTLLIDGDLRRPAIGELIRPSAAVVGLSECLSSGASGFDQYIQPDVIDNLSIMYSGAVPDNPQELLAAQNFESLMDSCLRDFEATIVDTSPANSCADSRRISSIAGYSIVVARRNQTMMSDVKTLIDQLRSDRATVVGTILNEA
jgi:protein-tyrosine kinase